MEKETQIMKMAKVPLNALLPLRMTRGEMDGKAERLGVEISKGFPEVH